MRITVLKSKLHLATVTRSDLYYHGSLTIDAELMKAVGIVAYEAILVSNVATGQRAVAADPQGSPHQPAPVRRTAPDAADPTSTCPLRGCARAP